MNSRRVLLGLSESLIEIAREKESRKELGLHYKIYKMSGGESYIIFFPGEFFFFPGGRGSLFP